jgi:hypothetical protein
MLVDLLTDPIYLASLPRRHEALRAAILSEALPSFNGGTSARPVIRAGGFRRLAHRSLRSASNMTSSRPRKPAAVTT